MYTLVYGSHFAAGAIALLTYWVAALSRKGSPVHRRAGRWYLLAMLLITATSVPLGIGRILGGQPVFGLFLLYLLLLVMTNLYCAWFAVQFKRDFHRYAGAPYRALAVAILAAGAGMFVIGVGFGMAVVWGFALIGVVRGAHMLWLARSDGRPGWSLSEHMGSMIGNGVATHVAFLSIGLRRILPDDLQQAAVYLAWFGPLLVAALASVVIVGKYGRKRAPVLVRRAEATRAKA